MKQFIVSLNSTELIANQMHLMGPKFAFFRIKSIQQLYTSDLKQLLVNNYRNVDAKLSFCVFEIE